MSVEALEAEAAELEQKVAAAEAEAAAIEAKFGQSLQKFQFPTPSAAASVCPNQSPPQLFVRRRLPRCRQLSATDDGGVANAHGRLARAGGGGRGGASASGGAGWSYHSAAPNP